jgi:lysyl-tRNA synthetase class 2
MLELYQAYGDYHDMMEITEEIIAGAAREVVAPHQPAGNQTIDFTPPWPRRRYGDLLKEYVGVDLHDPQAVLQKARETGVLARLTQPPAPPSAVPAGEARIDHALLVNALFEEHVEQHLIRPTFVLDYPAALCPLTKRHPEDPELALRFELYINGTEIANAYSELNDPAVQRANFAATVAGEGEETMRVMDEDFCEALEYGMPPAGGLGIGIDRLCMLLLGCASIRDVLLFPLQRPAGPR